MNTLTPSRSRRSHPSVRSLLLLSMVLATPVAPRAALAAPAAKSTIVRVDLSEWKVQTTPSRVPSGPVTFEVTNGGTIPHAFEVEGRGLERSTPQMQAGTGATLKVVLPAGKYELYCPVGKGSHKMLGMIGHLEVGEVKRASSAERGERAMDADHGHMMAHAADRDEKDEDEKDEYASGAKTMKVTGGGTVIQILPGAFPFADSASAVIAQRPPEQQADLTKKAHLGPYSNNVAPIAGDIALEATDRGASGDSVSGVARFTTQDGARWKVVMDRVQTKDIPFNPRFGGVIMGLFYHGASGVHTPLVPTIQASLALWAFAHLYKNDQLVTDDAMVHVMLLSRTRRPTDWALDCWDCSDRPIEELQLQVTPGPNTPAFDAPGGFLFVNWERSSGTRESL